MPDHTLTMLDLCSGLHGASVAMRERGWRVVSVDNLARTRPSVVADVRHLPLAPFPVDLLWASPPCTEYSRSSQPWFPNEPPPNLSIWQAVLRIIAEWRPRYYCIENVVGAQRFWGRATTHYRSRFLWTDIPMLGGSEIGPREKRRIWGGDPLSHWKRSLIPYSLSLNVAASVEFLCEGAG